MPKLDLAAIQSLTTGLEVQTGPVDMSVEFIFTTTLRIISEQSPTPTLEAMTRYAVDLITNGFCRLGMLIPVPELTFALTSEPSNPVPMIMIPFDWASRITHKPLQETGRIVNVSSMAVDYFNDRYVGQTDLSTQRADALEAELLHGIAAIQGVSLFVPDFYATDARQKELIKRFPEGTRGCQSILYPYRPFIPLTD